MEIDFVKSDCVTDYSICKDYKQYGVDWIHTSVSIKPFGVLELPNNTYIKTPFHPTEIKTIPRNSSHVADFIREFDKDDSIQIDYVKDYDIFHRVFREVISLKNESLRIIDISFITKKN